MNNFFSHIRTRKNNKQGGFSYIEVTIAVAIFVMLSSVLLGSYTTLNSRVNVDSLAHNIGQWVRDAQISAMSVRRSAISGTFPAGYGLHFETGTRQPDDVLGLVAEKADGLDVLGQGVLAQGKHLFRAVGNLEQLGGGLVHPDIGRLGRKRHGHDKGEGVGVMKLAFWLGLGLGKAGEDLLQDGIGKLRDHGTMQHETISRDKPQETGRGSDRSGLVSGSRRTP